MSDNRCSYGSGGIGGIGIWTFFSLMFFFTTPGQIPMSLWEFIWRFIAGPINFLFQ